MLTKTNPREPGAIRPCTIKALGPTKTVKLLTWTPHKIVFPWLGKQVLGHEKGFRNWGINE